jgi:hypothetical protein
LEHIAIAILIQVPVALALRNWAAGTAAACAWSLSRELTQAEYRWIEHYGSGLRANMPWWGGFDPRVWQKLDPWLDALLPCAVVLAVLLIVQTASRAKV